MTYMITYTEKLIHSFYVEADTPEEAEAEYNRMAASGELDFSDGDIVDTTVDIEKIGV